MIAWTEYRDWVRVGVFVQRVDANGAPLWTTNGVAVRATGTQSFPDMVADGAGGVIVAWGDGSDIYAQRVSAAATSCNEFRRSSRVCLASVSAPTAAAIVGSLKLNAEL